ncbi:MAG: nucleotidyltransferase domain-containing protein [Candidatus Uhrbacteria bacterium]|nr:nucleotidyltransferase domain-containing protein [Candidatus Uhrbacteria bacterium]
MRKGQQSSPEHEQPPIEITSGLPGAELLLDLEQASQLWPKEVVQDKEFLNQIEERVRLNERLNKVLCALPRPDISLESVVAAGKLSEDQVADLYESLEKLLAEGSEYQRILLYLPFEFLPSVEWKPTGERLAHAAVTFRETYLAAWERLLVTHDVRANFVDGDVMDVETRKVDLPRVVKVAHLIPKLVEAGFMTVEAVQHRMDETDDTILRESIADTLPVLKDMGFLPGESEEIEDAEEVGEVTLVSVERTLSDAFIHIESDDYGDITKKREVWLKQDGKRKAVDVASEMIRKAIEAGSLRGFELEEASVGAKQAYIEGVRKAVEAKAHLDKETARQLLAQHRDALELIWKTDLDLRDVLAKTFFRLSGLGVTTQNQLKEHQLTLPALGGPFSENLEGIKEELVEVRRIVESLERHPELSKMVYPVVLVYGSRIKGYGSPESDIDVAVFVRPEVQGTNKTRMRALLKEAFSHEKIGGEVTEFWMQAEGSHLRVVDPDRHDPMVGESYWTYVLFGAVWEGKQEAVAELQAKILPAYFYDDGKILYGRPARGLGLEELERDTLQYRLMHKGYERFYPSYGGMNTPHADSIDGKSTFWDSGYRQMATKLYASRLFLPKLERP